MARCSGSSRRIIDFARASLGIGDELGNRLSRDRWIYRHDKWCADNASDWRDIADEIVVELVVECCIDRVQTTDQEKRVAVRGRAHGGLGADIAAATRPAVDNKLLSEPLRQPLSDQARRDVGRSGGRDRHDQTHRPCRIGLRASDAGAGRQRGSACGQMQKLTAGKFHFEPPSRSDHSITSSARASSVGGTSRPSAFAVLRLITSWYLVGACTGRSAGFSPLRMRSTYWAAERNWLTRSDPYDIRPPASMK